MNTAKYRDVWLVAIVAGLLVSFGFTQATADRSNTRTPNYTIAVSTGPELRLVNLRGDIPKQGQALVCETLISIATTSIGHNCRPTISGIASTKHQ